jgi:hypothetical protein
MAKVKIDTKHADALLEQLPIEMRGKAMQSSIRNAIAIVTRKARGSAPVGDPSHNPDAPPLGKSITHKVKAYQSSGNFVGLVGGSWPDGAHSHLVDEGHDIVVAHGPRKGENTGTRAKSTNFFKTAISTTQSKVTARFESELKKAILKASK